MVKITELAAREIKAVCDREELALEKVYLKLGVKGGGCSGFSYLLDLTEECGEEDHVWEQHGIRVLCDPRSLLYIDGTDVDFKDELMGRGFVFKNPNATTTCGCGSSFSA